MSHHHTHMSHHHTHPISYLLSHMGGTSMRKVCVTAPYSTFLLPISYLITYHMSHHHTHMSHHHTHPISYLLSHMGGTSMRKVCVTAPYSTFLLPISYLITYHMSHHHTHMSHHHTHPISYLQYLFTTYQLPTIPFYYLSATYCNFLLPISYLLYLFTTYQLPTVPFYYLSTLSLLLHT